MKSAIAISVLLSSMLSWADSLAAPGWRGILPLHSTRADVERLLGPGTLLGQGNFRYGYYLDDVNVFLDYSTGDCKSGQGVWDVPSGVVLWITVHPKPLQRLSDLKLDESKFKKIKKSHIEGESYYENEEEGLTVVVYEGMVQTLVFGPAAKDQPLRCP